MTIEFEEHSCPNPYCHSQNTRALEYIKGGDGLNIGVQWICDDCKDYFQVLSGRWNE